MGRKQRQPFKLKLIYRILILFAIFVVSLWYFSGHFLTIRNFSNVTGETAMAEASIPHLTLVTNGSEINRLCGYTANLDWALNRETITPLGSDMSFTVKIFENKMTVRKLKYELYDVSTGNLLEENTISALTEGEYDNAKSVHIKFKSSLNRGSEYSVKFTLVTSDSKRIYYYTRVKVYANGYIGEKLAFAEWFKTSLLTKTNQSQIEKNLETKQTADRTDFSRVDINSNWTMASWGNMKTTLVSQEPPTITDFYEEYASIVLNYVIEAETDNGKELIKVRETYRLLYTKIRTYLYTFEREAETIFDVNNTLLSANDFKLGITNDTSIQFFTTANNKFTSFVHNGELWSYSSADNTMYRVFSFRNDEDPTDVNLAGDDHEIRILKQTSSGDLDFVVYGYMSRGEYEGRVGISFYHFEKAANRITELAHIPVNTTYELLKGEITDLMYRNNYDVIYIAMFDTVYSYNITTKRLVTVAENVPEGHFAYLEEPKYIVWQPESDNSKSDRIVLMNMENGEKTEWQAKADEVICLLGKIDSNAIVGYARKTDICRNIDGSTTVPMYKVAIVDFENNVLKSYEPYGAYVTGASVNDNMVVFERVKKRDGLTLSYESIDSDGLSNRVSEEKSSISIVSRTNNTMKKEYYISFPSSIQMKKIPEQKAANLTLLTTDRNVRILAGEDVQTFYRTYSFGQVVTRTAKLFEAVKLADSNESIGAVIDNQGRLVWERGVKSTRSVINGISVVSANQLTCIQACMKMLFKYEGYDVDTSKIDFATTDVIECMEQYIKVTGVDLKGLTGEQMLYYIYKKHPVIAITGESTAILITGYDANYIEYIDPLYGRQSKMLKSDAAKLFEKNGNTFYGYIK